MRATRRREPDARPTRSTRPPRRTPPPRLLLDDREVASMLAISPAMVGKLRRLGELPEIRIGRAVRVPAEAVTAYLDRVRTGSARDE